MPSTVLELSTVQEEDADKLVQASLQERLQKSELRVAFLEALINAKNSALETALGVGEPRSEDDFELDETLITHDNSGSEDGLHIPPLWGSSPFRDREVRSGASVKAGPVVSPIPSFISSPAQGLRQANEPVTDRRVGPKERQMVALQAGDFIRLRKDGWTRHLFLISFSLISVTSNSR